MVFALLLFTAVLGVGQTANNYADPKTWLCRPGVVGACDVDLTATLISANGKLKRETFKPAANPRIDCFYVYPTVSTDPTPNSDMTPDPAESNVIHQQFARFASVCRPFAPLYRQVTLAGLRSRMTGGGRFRLAEEMAYDDVRDAWRYYLDHDNQGRGFVLVGHSQGSFILAELIRQEIDGKPIQAKMISAIIPGATIAVPKGQDVGGAFQHVPVCRQASQTGCVIAYSAFRDTVPPPANTLFGRLADPAMTAVCVNPAALSGGSAPVESYFSTKGSTITANVAPPVWLKDSKQTVQTPWVVLPGLLTAECASNEFATYLKISLHMDAKSPRAQEIFGDIRANGQVRPEWGLHLVDMNLVMGNLLQIVHHQSDAWLKLQGG